MEIFILGDSNDQKGTELEKLCKRLFDKLGFDKSALNIVKSGANEYDVFAHRTIRTMEESKVIPIIAECKAHKKKCDLPDFLKFLGKLYCQKKENPNAEGYFIALSGVNGNFLGAYESLKKIDESIHLLVEEDLIQYLQHDYCLSDIQSIRYLVTQYTNRVIDSVDLALFDNKVFWLIRFNSRDYTIISSENEPLTEEDASKLHPLLSSYSYYNYVDLPQEQERLIRLSYVRGIILCFALNNNAKDQETVCKMLADTGISIEEFERVRCNDTHYISNEYPLTIQIEGSKVDFFKYLLSNYVFVETITAEQYQSIIDETFINEICEIQGGLSLTDEERIQATRLLKISHSAILNAIVPDKFIINSIRNVSIFKGLRMDKVRDLSVTKFMGMLIEGANEDFCTQPYSKILNKLGIQQFDVHQSIRLNAGQENELQIESNQKTVIAKAENLPGKPVLSVLSFN